MSGYIVVEPAGPADRITSPPVEDFKQIPGGEFISLSNPRIKAQINWEFGSVTRDLDIFLVKNLLPLADLLKEQYCIIYCPHGTTSPKFSRYNCLKVAIYSCPGMIGTLPAPLEPSLLLGGQYLSLESGQMDCMFFDGNIMDEEFNPVAHYEKETKTIHILYDLFHNDPSSTDRRRNLSNAVFKAIYEQIKNPIAWGSILEKKFNSMWKRSVLDRIPQLRHNIDADNKNIENYLNAYKDSMRNRLSNIKELEMLNLAISSGRGTNEYQELMDKISKSGKWKILQISGPQLEFISNVEVVMNINEVLVPIGKFKVTLPWNSGGKIGIKNESWVGGAHHPHIAENGNVCWGSIGSTVAELWAKREYFILLEIIWDYLHQYTANDCYQTIEKWVKNPEDLKKIGIRCKYCKKHPFQCKCARCSNCGSLLDECHCQHSPEMGVVARCERCGEVECNCETCEHCGEPYDDCSCERCPSSDERITNGYCNGCDNLGDDGECQY